MDLGERSKEELPSYFLDYYCPVKLLSIKI